MAKTRKPPIPVPDSDSSGAPASPHAQLPSSLSSPDAELARIRREMSGGHGRRLVLWALLCLVLVPVFFGAFAFWRFLLVTQSRKSFAADYANADRETLRTYAGSRFSQVEQKKQAAENANWFTDAKEVCSLYQDAARALSEAGEAANGAKKRHDRLMQRFDELYSEAQKNDLPKHAKGIWGQVEELRAGVGDQGKSDFAPDVACAHLTKAIELLEGNREFYADIKGYDRAQSMYLQAVSLRNEEEWSQVVPDALATGKGFVRRAETAALALQWKDAALAYRAATKALADGNARVTQARVAAEKAAEAFTRALGQTDIGKLERNAKAAWGGIQEQKASMEQAMAAYRYTDAARTAGEAVERLASTKKRVEEAKGRRDGMLVSLQKAFAQAGEYSKAFAPGQRTEWLAVEAAYGNVEALAKGEDYVSLLEQAEALSQRIEKLVDEHEALQGGLSRAQQACEKLVAKVDAGLFSANLPELWTRVKELRSNARRDGETGNSQGAVDAYQACTALLKEGIERLAALKAKARSLRETCSADYRQYRRGIDAFGGEKGAALKNLLDSAESFWLRQDYRQAAETFGRARDLLPSGRFVKQAQGTVIDYATALMWAADGAGEGCNGGKTSDWYAALVWVRGLRFGGHGDWRLPGDEELLTLARLPQAVRQEAFPNAADGAYWTRSHLPEDVARAFCVGFDAQKSELRSRKAPLHVRAVRGPQ